MKRLLLLIAVSIVWSGSVLQAQEYEYVPLVQEGVNWDITNTIPFTLKTMDLFAYNSKETLCSMEKHIKNYICTKDVILLPIEVHW